MAKNIKQRNVNRDIKTLDRTGVMKEKFKQSIVAARAQTKDAVSTEKDDRSAESYAGNKAEETAREAVYAARPSAGRRIKSAEGKAKDIPAAGKTVETDNLRQPQSRQIKPKELPLKNSARYSQTEKAKKAVAASLYSRMKRKAIREHSGAVAAKAVKNKAAAKGIKAAGAALLRTIRGIIAAIRGLILAISLGGTAAVIAILLIVVIAAILASALAIFFSGETGEGMSIGEAVVTLTEEYSENIERIIEENKHDELEMVYTHGDPFIDWKSVVAVYAVRTAEDKENPSPVIVFDEGNYTRLRDVFYDMNKVTYKTRTETRTRTVIEMVDGEEVQRTETYTTVILTITVTKKSSSDMADQYRFTKSQNKTLAELMKPEYNDLWIQLIGDGAFRDSGGERRQPSPDRNPKGIFSWPFEKAWTVTSWFGWRVDPIDGQTKYHEGIDIGASGGTPILAAADGIVSFSNATDSYGGGYGYYVKIKHTGGFETLYAHCSAVAVRSGAPVSKGQIIGYVGSSGRSTANHLHWEIYLNGSRVDPLSYFE